MIAAAAISMMLADLAAAEPKRGETMLNVNPSSLSVADIESVSPALARFGREAITDDLWKRDALSIRDRSIVTLAILIARNQPAELQHYAGVALDSGVTPAEVSEIITHLAFYSGWPNAMSAIAVTKNVFQARGIGADQLAKASGTAATESDSRTAAFCNGGEKKCGADLTRAGQIHRRSAVSQSVAAASAKAS